MGGHKNLMSNLGGTIQNSCLARKDSQESPLICQSMHSVMAFVITSEQKISN